MVEEKQDSPPRWYGGSPEDLGRELGVVLSEGLAETEAKRRLSAHGRNELPAAPSPSPWSILRAQFTSLIIWVLIGAALAPATHSLHYAGFALFLWQRAHER